MNLWPSVLYTRVICETALPVRSRLSSALRVEPLQTVAIHPAFDKLK